VGIHLNNNGIALNTKFFKEVMELFEIKEADLIACNRSKLGDAKGEAPNTGNYIDYNKWLKKYFTLSAPTINQDDSPQLSPLTLSTAESELTPGMRVTGAKMGGKGLNKHEMFLHSYKDHIIFGKEVKILEKFKKINDI